MIKRVVVSLLFLILAVAFGQPAYRIPDSVFVNAAIELQIIIKSSGEETARSHVAQCYQDADVRESTFSNLHASCMTKDYLLTSLLVLPTNRASWYPPYKNTNTYEELVPAFRARVKAMHDLLRTSAEVADATRVRMFMVAPETFDRDLPVNVNASPEISNAPASAPLTKTELVSLGRKPYEEYCGVCHKGNGSGIPGSRISSLRNSGIVNSSNEGLIRFVLFNEPKKEHALWYRAMSPIAIASTLTYIRVQFSNTNQTSIQVSEVNSELSKRAAERATSK